MSLCCVGLMDEGKEAVLMSPENKKKWPSTSSSTVLLDEADECPKADDDRLNEEHQKTKSPKDRRKLFARMSMQSSSIQSSSGVQEEDENGLRGMTAPRGMSGRLLDVTRHTTFSNFNSRMTVNGEEEDDAAFVFNMGDPLHEDILLIGRWRNRAGCFINARVCQWIFMAMILINAGILGALTFLYDNPEASRVLETIDMAFLAIFTFETVLQAFYLGPVRYFKNLWLLWDFLIITLSWIFLSLPSISVMRSFRIFRIFVLFSRSESMRHLVQAVGRTLPKMASIWFALILFFYTFCVLYTDLYHGLYDEDYLDYDYFGRLDRTFLTLFQFMTLDSWSKVVRQVQEARPAALIGFCIWIIVTAFFVMNLMVAVICESLIELNNMRDTKRQNKMLRQQRHLISAQTQELLEETHEVVKLQRELLANQVIMQQLLVQVVTHNMSQDGSQESSTPGDCSTAEQPIGGKGALLRLMTEIEEENESPHDDATRLSNTQRQA